MKKFHIRNDANLETETFLLIKPQWGEKISKGALQCNGIFKLLHFHEIFCHFSSVHKYLVKMLVQENNFFINHNKHCLALHNSHSSLSEGKFLFSCIMSYSLFNLKMNYLLILSNEFTGNIFYCVK